MSVLRLGVYRLPAAEVAVIRTIVQLYANDVAFPWTLVNALPYDALLVDESATPGERAEFALMAGAVLVITRGTSGGVPHTLERPIRADRLQQWLKSTERSLQEAQPGRWGMQEQIALEMEVSDSVRFTLRRWPSSLLLRNDPDKVRMASLLSRRALNASELADLSELPLSQCVTFLQTLRSVSMLEQHVTPAVGRAYAELQGVQGISAAIRGEFGRSLINGIRRRLGLGTP